MNGSFLHANVAVILAITALGILLGLVWPQLAAAIRHAWEKTRT